MLKISEKRPPLNISKDNQKPQQRRAISVKKPTNLGRLNQFSSTLNSRIVVSKPASPDPASEMSLNKTYETGYHILEESAIRTLDNTLDQSTLFRQGDKNMIVLNAIEGAKYDTQPYNKFVRRIKSPLVKRQSPIKTSKPKIFDNNVE